MKKKTNFEITNLAKNFALEIVSISERYNLK